MKKQNQHPVVTVWSTACMMRANLTKIQNEVEWGLLQSLYSIRTLWGLYFWICFIETNIFFSEFLSRVSILFVGRMVGREFSGRLYFSFSLKIYWYLVRFSSRTNCTFKSTHNWSQQVPKFHLNSILGP